MTFGSKILNRNTLKFIAMFTMVIDHIGRFYSGTTHFIMTDVIGRIAFPIFLFLLVDGYKRTKNKTKHIRDLLLFAIISEPIHDKLFYGQWFYLKQQNVLFTFALCWLLLIALDKVFTIKDKPIKIATIFFITIVFSAIAYFYHVNYDISAIVGCTLLYVFSNYGIFGSCGIESMLYGTPGCLLAIPIVLLYNPNKICVYNKLIKYVFYVFYPLHLSLLYVLQVYYF